MNRGIEANSGHQLSMGLDQTATIQRHYRMCVILGVF